MKQKKKSKWRRYLNILLGIGTPVQADVAYSTGGATYEPSSNTADRSGDIDYRSSSERFMHSKGREVYMASGRPGAPEIEYCGI
jgi:hypothetical protein